MSTLSPGVVTALLAQADVMTEGDIRGGAFFGTTMLTVDLRALSRLVRIDPQRDGAMLCERLGRSAELRLAALRLARMEAERRTGGRLPGILRAEVSTRTEGEMLYVDVDVELEVDEPLQRGTESTP